MKIPIFISVPVLLCLPLSAHAQDKSTAPVLVELFTAENCPACPPADQYLKKLAQSKTVIAMACHVDYFPQGAQNLGKDFCTKRQAVYMARMGRKKWFTPHMMINGHLSEVGHKAPVVAAKITKARKDNVAPITITPRGNNVYDYLLPSRVLNAPAQIWMAVYDRPHMGKIRGARREFTNVVQSISPQGVWQGQAMRSAFFPILNAQSGGIIVAAQDPDTGSILAAGEYKFGEP